VQAAHFSESPRTTIDKVEFPPSLLKRVFEPEELINSFSGHNYIPFSGCLFPTKVLRDLPKDLVERITFYEDFATMLFAISACESPPAFFPSLISGISIRSDESQSVTVGDRDLWNQSMAELDSIFFDSARAGLIADIVNASTFKKTDARLTRDENIVQHLLSQRDDAIEHLEVLAKSWTWRFTRPLRALSFVKRKLSDRKDSIDLQR